MGQVSIRELRNHGGEVIDRVAAGERVTVTRDGVEVAELRPLARRALTGQILLEQWRSLPVIDAGAFRHDVDSALDSSL